MQKQRNEAVGALHVLSEEKVKQEKELLIKFVLVLNEKKKKIRELRKELAAVPPPQIKKSKDHSPLNGEAPSQSQPPAPSLSLQSGLMSLGTQTPSFNLDEPIPSNFELLDGNTFDIQTTVRKR